MKPRNPHHLLVFLIAVVALEAILFSAGSFKLEQQAKNEENRRNIIVEKVDQAGILAKAVSIYDITDNKKIYGKNDDVPLPIASLTKIVTVLVGLQGHKLSDVVSISSKAVNQEGDFGIFAYEKWEIGDLAKFTLIVSANDGAYALAQNDISFLEKMNSKAKIFDMQKAKFFNFTGLDIDTKNAGAYATATDINMLARFALLARPEVFSVTTSPEINLKSKSGFIHNFKNTDTIVEKIPNLLFSKTGYTELAGGNLVIIFKDKNKHLIAVTVLGSTRDGRFSDMEKIAGILYNN